MMTRRDFEIVATALHAAKKELNSEAAKKFRDKLISDLCVGFKNQYFRFDETTFKYACDNGVGARRVPL